MDKYVLGFTAGVSVVPFAYLVDKIHGGTEFYVSLLVIPSLVVAITAFIAFKTDTNNDD
ncbi:hypothetical protein [Pseudoalteromonas sp. GB56]